MSTRDERVNAHAEFWTSLARELLVAWLKATLAKDTDGIAITSAAVARMAQHMGSFFSLGAKAGASLNPSVAEAQLQAESMVDAAVKGTVRRLAEEAVADKDSPVQGTPLADRVRKVVEEEQAARKSQLN